MRERRCCEAFPFVPAGAAPACRSTTADLKAVRSADSTAQHHCRGEESTPKGSVMEPSIIYVLAQSGKPLMPTKRQNKVWYWLRTGLAEVVSRHLFTIRLHFETGGTGNR